MPRFTVTAYRGDGRLTLYYKDFLLFFRLTYKERLDVLAVTYTARKRPPQSSPSGSVRCHTRIHDLCSHKVFLRTAFYRSITLSLTCVVF